MKLQVRWSCLPLVKTKFRNLINTGVSLPNIGPSCESVLVRGLNFPIPPRQITTPGKHLLTSFN